MHFAWMQSWSVDVEFVIVILCFIISAAFTMTLLVNAVSLLSHSL